MRRIMIDLDVGLLCILKGALNHGAKRGYETLPEKKKTRRAPQRQYPLKLASSDGVSQEKPHLNKD